MSKIGELKLPDINFKYDITLEIPCFVAHDIAKIAMARFSKDNVQVVPTFHTTLWDGSEKDAVAYYGNESEEHVLVEISHSWIDPHFLWFWLWLPDVKKRREYPGLLRSVRLHRSGGSLSPCSRAYSYASFNRDIQIVN